MSNVGLKGTSGQLRLVFVNGLGPNFKGDNIYEFIFSNNIDDIWDDTWEHKPANGYPKPPELEFIKKVGILKNTTVCLDLIQDSDFFCFSDAMDGVIALAWERDDLSLVDFNKTKRLVFRFGETDDEIKDKLYERDIVLEFEKNLVYEDK